MYAYAGDSNMSGSLLSLETTSEAPNGSVDFESSPEGSFGENQFTGLDDDDDDQSSNRHFDMPRKGIVLYDYEATKEDELSIHEGEEVSVPWYDGFGWCKVCVLVPYVIVVRCGYAVCMLSCRVVIH